MVNTVSDSKKLRRREMVLMVVSAGAIALMLASLLRVLIIAYSPSRLTAMTIVSGTLGSFLAWGLSMRYLDRLKTVGLHSRGSRVTRIIANALILMVAFVTVLAMLIGIHAAPARGVVEIQRPILLETPPYLFKTGGKWIEIDRSRYLIVAVSRAVSFHAFLIWFAATALYIGVFRVPPWPLSRLPTGSQSPGRISQRSS